MNRNRMIGGTMKNLMTKVAIAVAGAFAVATAQAQTTITKTDSTGTLSAQIRDSGDIYGTSPADGLLGLNWNGTEFVNIDNGSAWYWYKDSSSSYLAQYTTSPWTTTTTPISGSSLVVNGGDASGLSFSQTTEIASGNLMTVSVTLHNDGAADLSGVYWGVGFDPDQGGSAHNFTRNTIFAQGDGAAVSAYDQLYGTGMAVTLANTTSAAAYSIQAFVGGDCCSAVDPTSVVGQGVGFNNLADDSISLAYDIGTIGVGKAVTFGYSYSFATPVPEPQTYAMLLAGLGLMGFVVSRRRKNLPLDGSAA